MSPVVYFDGVCNFCDASINFIIRHDRQKKFRFATLQSEQGVEMKVKFGIGDDVDSIILVEDGQAYSHSTAALRIAKGLGGIWSMAYIFIMVPRPIRDFLYKAFAKQRYRLFGKKDVCMMPTPDIRERFI